MKASFPTILLLSLALPLSLVAHTTTDLPTKDGRPVFTEEMRQHILDDFMQSRSAAPKSMTWKTKPKDTLPPKLLQKPTLVAAGSAFDFSSLLGGGSSFFTPPAGNGLLMQASFAPFKPKVRFNWDPTTFFVEGDNMPEGMPNRMVGITTWQQQVPLPAAYFASSTNNENSSASLGYQQPNYWRIPLVPVPAASPIVIYNPPTAPTHFLRGAVALASNGIAIFNPANNTGQVSYEIGELDYYGGHCGLADDYHYHIIPTHLSSRFGGPLGDDKPVAWALDGYPIYGFLEPDGSARQALDADGGHDIGNGWGYHYHAMGTTTTDATHPYGSPQSPYMMKNFHGTVVEYPLTNPTQVDGQPEVGNLRQDGTGGYNAKAISGAYIVAIMNPAPLVTDGSGNLNLAAGVNLTNCSTTYGSTTVNCASTTGLTVGLAVVGYGVSNNATVTQVTNGTQFVISSPAIIASSGKSFTAVSLAGASPDAYLMRVNMGGTDYDECWTINRKVNPRSLTMTWRAQALISGVLSGPVLTTTQTYTPTAGGAAGNRLTAYPMGAWSEAKLPDTGQVVNTTPTFGEDGDYTTTPQANPQSFTDNGNGTITDNVTGLMWQKVDAGEMTWENAVTNASSVSTGGYSDWRLPNPQELFSIMNHENGNPNAMSTTYFPTGSPAAEYWWTRDIFGASTTNVWCVNAGGGLGPKPKAETLSAGGAFRYHARYVRLAQNNLTHNYTNNGDGTITDNDTSLMWAQLPGSAMNWEAALTYSEGLTTGGYSDWRLPNIKELQTLTDYALATTSGGAATNLKPCINRTMFAKTMAGCATTIGSPTVTTSDTTGLVVGMTVVDPYSVAGTYINHATTPTITAINPNVSFTLSSNAAATGSGLTLRALPVATAYWSSTSNKGTTTEAWLLELGVNNAVPVAEGPNRGSQGIISYQAKTASFPVFAVRTAVLTTNIAVSQGATSLSDGISTVAYGNVNVGSSLSKTFTINNTGSGVLNITGVTIDGTNSANFSVTSPPASSIAASGSTTFTVLFNALTSGNKVAALHIASDDAGNPSFDVNLSGTGFVPPPTISNIAVNPISPTSTDPVTVTAQVAAGNGGAISGVNLTYDLGAQVSTDVFKEVFANAASNNWNGTTPAAINAWSTVGAGNTRQALAASNRTPAITLAGSSTTSGSPNVACGSTTGLWPGMMVSGPNIPVNGATATKILSITDATHFVLTANATTTGTTTLIVNGASLTNCTTVTGAAPVTVTCDNTGGLFVGMSLTGTGLANNTVVSAVTDLTHFTMSPSPTTAQTGITITASCAALEFQAGSATAASATTTNVINTSGTSGYVEFYTQTRDLFATNNNGWTFDVFDGTTWNTRISEDWNSNTVSLANCVLNTVGAAAGSTTVTCTSTAGLTVGRALYGPTIYSALSCGTTPGSNVVSCLDTTGLQVNMFVTGTNIPNNTRIGAITTNTSFTLVNGNSPGTAVNATGTAAGSTVVAATYLNPAATVSAVNVNGTQFTISQAAFFNTTAAPIAVSATTLNHGFTAKADGTSQPYHYNLAGAELGANTKIRFQFIGYSATAPTRAPRCNVDDIVINKTTGAAPISVTMYDDGTHGDAVAGDGIYTGTIPAQANNSTVNFTIAATGTGGSGTTTSSATSYTVAPAPTITTVSPLPAGNTTAAYNQTLTATGGSGTGYTWSVFSGALPPGITLSSGGVLSGTATSGGTFNFTAKVTDSLNRSGTKAFALTISATTPPNVVIIITDDQGWGDVGYHTPVGQVPIQTPNMDSFGTTLPGSIRLERFYATTVCSVTRSTLATGRNPIRHATNNVRGVPLSEHMMPQSFKAAGYQTWMSGKWHNGGSDKNTNHFTVNGNSVRFIQEGLEYAPFNRGWDEHYGQYSGAIDYFTHHSAETDSLDIPDWWLNGVQQDGPSEHTDSQGHGGWSPDLEADRAIYHIQNRNPNQPFLLHLAFNSIHGPISAPPALITKYANLGITNTGRRLTAAAVDGMDQAMGRVLAAIDAAGITNNTVVVWFGDNGGDETKGSLNDPLRGDKGDSYEGGLHEVAGIRWPGVLAPSGPVISNQYLWVGDLFPTLAAAVGVTPQNTKPMDGLNMWPALLAASPTTTVSRGAPLVTDQAAPIAIYQFTDPVNGGTKDFKLRRGRVANVVTPELFNLTDDPYETTDLIANSAYASIVTTLTNAITSITADNNPPYIGPPMITSSVAQGGTITLYAPFTSYKAPTIQWRKGGSSAAVPGTAVSTFTQIVDSANALVTGSYAATLTLTNVAPGDAGTYDVVITNVGGTTTSTSGVLTVTFGSPVLNALPAYTKGTSQTVTWPSVAGATSYTIQRSATSDFAIVLSSQTVSIPTATFTGLTSGSLYYYRATATDGTTTSGYSNTVSSTQDAGNPVVAITAPADGVIVSTSTVNVQGTATDAISGIAGVTVNGVAATTADNFAHWSATIPLVSGANSITATATDTSNAGGNAGAAAITVTLSAVAPVISNVATGPTAPTYLDPVTVYAQVAPGASPISLVQLIYNLGTPVSTTIWREIFNNTSSNNWNGTGSLNAWTTVGAGNVRQAVSTSNHTSITVTGAATTNGSTTVTCNSTANLWPGMLITGTNIPGSINGTAIGNTTIASITNPTTFVLSQAATGTGTGLTLNIASVVLSNCTATASVNVTCDNTAGLINGMSLTGTGLANNAAVASVTGATTFTMNVAPTTPGSALTITAGTAAAEFNGGTASLSGSMFTTTNAINTTGTAGYIEFWVQTRDLFATNNCGWTMQVSPTGLDADFVTRLSEDWNSETVNLSNVVLNSTGLAAGSTTVTCTSTAGLTTGRSVTAAPVPVTIGITSGQSTATCTNVAGLVEGMFITATGIPNNTRIGTITPGVSPAGSFTLVTGTTATLVNATATNASAAAAATYFAGNATVSSITNGTTFTLNTAAYANTSAAPITTAYATTVNHAAQLFHYDLAGAELGATTKIRFQATGYTATAPTRTPRISIDDIVVATTAPPPTVTVTMFDDGNHGDGAAGDGLYAAQIPFQAGGTNVTYQVRATDNAANTTTSPGSGSYGYTVNSSLTDATIINGTITGGPMVGAEFLTLPTSNSVTVNAVFTVNQNAYVEYGTQPGKYTSATPATLFSVDNAKPEFQNPVRIAITGLQPDTEYYYRLRHKNTGAGFYNARGERSFHTARPRGTTFKFTITADPHLDVNTDQPLLQRAMDNIATDNPDIHIDLGDIFMTDKMDDSVTTGLPAIWGGGVTPGTLNQTMVNNRAMLFRNQFERCCHSIPFFFTLGNHEAEYGYLFNAAADKLNNIPAWDLRARKAFFPAPTPYPGYPDLTPSPFYSGNPTPKDYSGGSLGLLEDYYSWEWGEALFIVLDPFWNTTTNPNSAVANPVGDAAWNWSLGKPQYDWLKATLKNSSAKYKFVFMHHIVGGSTTLADGVTKNIAARGGVEVAPKYEWGGKNTDGSDGFATYRPGWDMPIHNLFVQNKVNVVFHGHDHFYGLQTLDGVNYLECPQPGTANYVTLGSAGDGKYSTGILLPNSGHVRVTVSPEQVIADFVRAYRPQDENASRHNMDISNSFTIRPTVFPPMELTAVAPGQVSLRWNAERNKTYDVQWSTDLVTWTTISTKTTTTDTNATYTDTLPVRINGQRAFYRVSYPTP